MASGEQNGRGIEAEGSCASSRRAAGRRRHRPATSTPGEIYGFLGPNGAGKSTTVLMLTTLLPPTAGTARVGGFDIVREGPRVRAAIGAALQEAALDPLLTGREHMRLQAALHGLAKRRPRAPRPTSCSSGSASPRRPTARSAATRAG